MVGFVVSANDLYWEGEEDASNEFLEVKHEDSSLLGGLSRTKRQWFDSWWSAPKKEEEAETVTEADPNDNASYGKDDADVDVGSGAPDKSELEPKEKTLRVTFLVMEPYITAYSNRDSPEFLNISRSLANAVDLLFESLPGTQRSSLVRIQSLVNDDFLCKVTLDIVTTRNEDTDTIKEILRNHIKNNGRLGETSVRDGDFSAQVIDPGTTLECDENEFTCDDNVCLPLSVKCDKHADCKDGTDELDCPETTEAATTKEPEDDYDDRDDTFDNLNNYDQYSSPSDYQTNYSQPGVTDSSPYESAVPISAILPTSTTTASPDDYYQSNRGDLGNADSSIACPPTYIRCDVMRCIEPNRVCDGASDCTDGTDEANCPNRKYLLIYRSIIEDLSRKFLKGL
ncbi:unnamed protein product [Spodoptera littoralis]|uniref:SEA domain-containing protein n=1 Tax=Spodoptera littoralis TaxID=7109 RepID=A0A9P0IIA7_SPOLI|nr:unnamed protein product [Spodoptera littoralis]CAH1647866.1 unnamed protein product [Spodoptera littoralis]